MYNYSWNEGYDPPDWKVQLIIPALKPGKDPSLPSSYRPISLISCLGKLFEKMIQERLIWWVETYSLLPTSQCGFRKGRSTIDNLVLLQHHIYRGFKENKFSLVIFF